MVIEKLLTAKQQPTDEFNPGELQPAAGLHDESHLFPPVEESCEVTVACWPDDYSASRLARAIEDCDAQLLNLNVSSRPLETGEMTVELRAGLRNPDSAVRALERYGYRVVGVHTPLPEDIDRSLTERIDLLLNHLNL